MISHQIQEAAARLITADLAKAGISSPPSFQWESVGGGSINRAYRIMAGHSHTLADSVNPGGGRQFSDPAKSSPPAHPPRAGQPFQWFCKVNTLADFPGMFEKEILGLKRLENPGGAIVPRIIGYTIAGQSQVLVLEWVEPGRAKIDLFWSDFGERLARMHRVTSDFFGLEEDNYMGALPQSNTLLDQWTDFFVRQRLEPQVRLAVDKSLLTPPIARSFEQLYKRLPTIFPPEPPALLHGDLWSGNFLRGPGGQAVLIDPAVYFGHRSMDLAMTTLFGGFDRGFYESYDHHFPFPENYREQWAVCNLYPLLIHLNLFGAGYLGEIVETLKLFN